MKTYHWLLLLLGFYNYTCDHQPVLEYQAGQVEIVEVARSEQLWTGVAVSQDKRIFVNYPRWSQEILISAGEIYPDGSVRPYPDSKWNAWLPGTDPEKHFVCVQSVYVDRKNDLWILDAGNAYLQGVIPGGAKLVKVDLEQNQVIKTIYFREPVIESQSYLNDIRVDVRRSIAYITDSGTGAIVLVNLTNGQSRRVLSQHPSTKAEDILLTIEGREMKLAIHADGLALDPPGDYLYYQALAGRSLYRIRTAWMRDFSCPDSELETRVEYLGQSGASDAIECAPDGKLYLTSLEYNAIRRFTPGGMVETVVRSEFLKWPDSFSITQDGMIYVTTSQLHLGGYRTEPYRIFQLVPKK